MIFDVWIVIAATLSGASSVKSQADLFILSCFHEAFIGGPLGYFF